MRELSETAQADIIKLTGGKPWCELMDITLPADFSPSATELTFLAVDPDGAYHILVTNSIMESRVALASAGWTTGTITPTGYKWFWGVPYQRDTIEDSSDQQGEVNTRITIGDTGGTIKSIVDQCDGLVGLSVTIGLAMINTGSILVGYLECFEPDVSYDFIIKTTSHDNTSFACSLCVDSPIEWKFPHRTMFKNVCHFAFKGLECGFNGNLNQIVRPSRGEKLIGREIFNGYWVICGGYVEKLEPDGNLVTTGVLELTQGDYQYITTINENYFYAKRESSGYPVYFNGTTASYVEAGAYYVIFSHASYPLEVLISSGAAGRLYAITYTASTRRLYKFEGIVASRVGSTQYYNIVSSASADVAFAVQGGTYSGGTFTPSDQATGRLVRVDNVTQASISEDVYWKWVLAVSGIMCYAVDANNKLWVRYTNEAENIVFEEVMDGFPLEEPAPEQIVVSGTLNRKTLSIFSETGWAFLIVDGALRVIDKDVEFYTENTKIWHSVKAISDTVCVGFTDTGLAMLNIESPENHELTDIPSGSGSITSFAGCDNFSALSPKFYYSAGSDIYLYQYKPYATCNHTLTDCKERGNEMRFGGFPGIGSGGLTK